MHLAQLFDGFQLQDDFVLEDEVGPKTFFEADARVKVLNLARNFGHQSAVTAGLDQASGDAVVVMDADFTRDLTSFASTCPPSEKRLSGITTQQARSGLASGTTFPWLRTSVTASTFATASPTRR